MVSNAIVYTAGNGESNSVVFSTTTEFGGVNYDLRDQPAPINAIPPCFNGNGDTHRLNCPLTNSGDPSNPTITLLKASLGDGNDTVSILIPLATSIGAGSGTDTMNGGPVADELRGGPGVDTIKGNSGADTLFGDDKNDAPDGGNDVLQGGPDHDIVLGEGGDDTLVSEATPDGPDYLSGGAGFDTVTYEQRTAPVTITLDSVDDDGQAGEGDDIEGNVENGIGGSASDKLVGSFDANHLEGRAGNDTVAGAGGPDNLEGGDGDDTLNGDDGDDAVVGGAGNDAADGGSGNDSLDGGSGNDSVGGGAGNDGLAGGAGADSLQGGDGFDSLAGGDDGDNLNAGADNDSLDGGTGDDTMDGGTGADNFAGGEGADLADYGSRSEALTVSLDGNGGDGGPGEGDNVGVDVENLRGGSGADSFFGSAAANALDAGAGEDYADGGAGPDVLTGGAAGDVLRSRDGQGDQLTCGDGPDFVVGDSADVANPDCDRVDRGVNQKPKLRDSAVVAPTRGALAMSPRGIVRRVPLQDKVVLPLRSIVDTAAGAVKVTSSASSRKVQSVALDSGAFDITQAAGKLPVTQFALQGGDFGVCGVAASAGRASAAARAKAKVVRSLWANGKGKFRTKGRYASATIRGTKWQIQDRCDGTLVTVARGAVTVRDLVKKRNVVVRAGDSYLARRG